MPAAYTLVIYLIITHVLNEVVSWPSEQRTHKNLYADTAFYPLVGGPPFSEWGEIYTQPPAEIKGLRPPLLAKGCFAITKKTATQAQRVIRDADKK